MKILFMCVANSARSQLAEGLGRALLGKNVEIASAGSRPGKVNPCAIQVLKEIGIDISQHYSKRVDDLPKNFIDNLDYVVTLCAEEVCPVILSKAKKLHWPLLDPASSLPLEAQLLAFRQTRDILSKLIQDNFSSSSKV